MERRSRPDFEVWLEKKRVLVDADPPIAVMHRIGWVGVDEGAGGNELGALGISELLGSRWRWKDVREDEEPESNTESRAEHAAENEDRDSTPKSAHGFTCVLVVSCQSALSGEGRELRPRQAIVQSRRHRPAIRSGRRFGQGSRCRPGR